MASTRRFRGAAPSLSSSHWAEPDTVPLVLQRTKGDASPSRAFDYLSPGWLRIAPTFDLLRSNPRFKRLVEGQGWTSPK
jgi:hypothetical protein